MSCKLLLSTLLFLYLANSQKLVLVGGDLHDDNELIYSKYIEMATDSQGNQYIGIVTGASDAAVAVENGIFYMEIFRNFGVTNVEWIPIHEGNPNIAFDQEWVGKVESMTGIFFGGGDQLRLTNTFYTNQFEDVPKFIIDQTPLLAVIRKNLAANKLVVGGTSAGTTIQQRTPMITGGTSYYGLKFSTQDHSDDEDGNLVSYNTQGGFGLLTHNMFLDSHFGTRGRQGRLIALMFDRQAQSGAVFGAGIDQNTALVIDGSHATILGQGGVSFFDLRQAKIKGFRTNGVLEIKNVTLTYLTSGDEFDLEKFEVIRFDCAKTHISGHETHQLPMDIVHDVFNSPSQRSNDEDAGYFTHVAQDLLNSVQFNNTPGFSNETNPTFRVDFLQNQFTRGYYDTEDKDIISFQKMNIDIIPVFETKKSNIIRNALNAVTEFLSSLFTD